VSSIIFRAYWVFTGASFLSSLSLASVNGYSIAVDSTWFNGSRSTRQDDNDFRGQSEPRQVKLHFACCPRTHVITAALVLDRDSDDGNQLPELLDTSARNRAIHEVLADKGYSEVENLEKIASIGALAFISFPERKPPKDGKPSRPNPSAIWRAALLCYNSHREYFLKFYHQRSNAETVVSMLIDNNLGCVSGKRTPPTLRSKNVTAMKNEVYCMVICHNIWCTINSIYEHGNEVNLLSQHLAEAE